MSTVVSEVLMLERAAAEVGATYLRVLVTLLLPGRRGRAPAADELTPEQIERIHVTVWRLQNAIEELTQARGVVDLRAALTSLSFLAREFADQIIGWIDVIDTLIDEAERQYGTQAGRGAYKVYQLKGALLYMARREGFALPIVPGFVQPFVFDHFATIIADFIVAHLNDNALWNFDALPRRPSGWRARVSGPLSYRLGKLFEFLAKFLVGVAWRIVLSSFHLSPRMRAAVDRLRPNVSDTMKALASLEQFVVKNPNYVRAAARVLSIAVQQAETFAHLSGPQKQVYARELILAFLEQNGLVDPSGLWREIVAAWIDLAINATVALFNRRRLFPFEGAAAG